MCSEYPIYLGNERIGSASVGREGLYYRICCQCRLSGAVPCRIVVTGKKDVDLGLCVPVGDHFGLETRVQMKRIGEGDLHFQVLPRHKADLGQLIPISPEEPFHYIERLKNAYLSKRDGQTGLIITDRSPDQQGSGQIP